MVLVPINPNVKQRETKWICVCPNCQHERIISYTQKWNISTNKNSDMCRSCSIELGLIILNIKGLEIGRTYENQIKAHKNRIGIKRPSTSKRLELEHVFNPEKMLTDAIKNKQRIAKLGKRGSETNQWKGGTTSFRKTAMGQDRYKKLRKEIFNRDNYTCQICFTRGGKLEMDHIKEWCNYPDLRYDPNNCRILCKECHKKTDNYANKAIKKNIKCHSN